MADSKELTKPSDNTITPLDSRPDYLPANVGGITGVEGLTKDDYKTPRITLLQALSPQVKSFPGIALPDQFWHTGMNVPLGNSFNMIATLVNKRVVVFRPRSDAEQGMIAFSRDAKNWDSGGNQTVRVKLKDVPDTVIWNTGKDVLSSRLLEFGTSNPANPKSPPAATLFYEYLCYLPDMPDLSPCVLGISKTGIPNGKSLNTSLLMLSRKGIPTSSIQLKCLAETEHKGSNTWTVPNFKLMGYAPKSVYDEAKKIAEMYTDYNVEYTTEEVAPAVDDEIPF